MQSLAPTATNIRTKAQRFKQPNKPIQITDQNEALNSPRTNPTTSCKTS